MFHVDAVHASGTITACYAATDVEVDLDALPARRALTTSTDRDPITQRSPTSARLVS